MDLISFLVIFIILALVSVLWRYWLNGFLKTRTTHNLGTKSTEPQFRIDPKAYDEYREQFPSAVESPALRGLPSETSRPALIEREVKIQYSSSIYVKKTFRLEITIEGKGKSVTIRNGGKTSLIEKLSFEAFEREPIISVELKFTEGEFKIGKNKEIQKLTDKTTFFYFLVTPLKAEDCVLNIVFSTIDKIPAPEKTTEKVITEKIINPETGKKKIEHSETKTIVPFQIVEKENEIKSIDIAVSVKSLFGLNASQLDFLKRAAGFAVSLIILGFGIVSGELKEIGAIIGAAVSLAPLLGIEIADVKFSKRDEDNSENSPET